MTLAQELLTGDDGAAATRDYRATYTSTANQTAYTFSSADIGSAAADRIVAVGFVGHGVNNTVGTAVTIGGNSATVPAGSNINTADLEVGFAYLAVAAGTTATVVVTFAAGKVRAQISVWAIYGADGTHTDADETSLTSVASISLSALTVPAGGVGLGIVGHSNVATTGWGWTGMTERYDATLENDSRYSTADTDTAGANTITAAVNTAAPNVAMAGIAFGPA